MGKSNRPIICLTLNCYNFQDIKSEIEKYGSVCQMAEWRVDLTYGAENFTREDFIKRIMMIKSLLLRKKLIVTYKGDREVNHRLLRWAMGYADIIDIDFLDPEMKRLIRETKRTRTEAIVSYHDMEGMPLKSEISTIFLKMERTDADYIKLVCMVNKEEDSYSLLEGAAEYNQLRRHTPFVALAMGDEGQVSRICCGDFGSFMTYASGSISAAPGQIDALKLSSYMDGYYKNE